MSRPLGLCLLALRAVWRAHLRRRRYRARPRAKRRRKTTRRRALLKLGGRCACCGLGMDFWPVLTFHHVHGNGREHGAVLRAMDTGVVGWVVAHPSPGEGLFAVEVLCEVCHRMTHEAGGCPHGRKRREAA